MADIDEVLALAPGAAKLNLHASYAIFEEGKLQTGMLCSRSIFEMGGVCT